MNISAATNRHLSSEKIENNAKEKKLKQTTKSLNKDKNQPGFFIGES